MPEADEAALGYATSSASSSNGKPGSACIPCFKRKMKCNREIPCFNCRRRRDQSEQCHYPSVPSADSVADLKRRLEKLEEYIRASGADPDEVARSNLPTPPHFIQDEAAMKPNVSVMDSSHSIWPGRFAWSATLPTRLPSPEGREDTDYTAVPDMIPFTLFRQSKPLYLAYEYPPASVLQLVWKHYITFVHPLYKMFFQWQKQPLIEKACTSLSTLGPNEHAIVLNLILLTIAALTEDRCIEFFQKQRSQVFNEYQRLAEYALWDASVTNVPSIENFQALMMYTWAMRFRGADGGTLLTMTSILSGHAERLGLHRDGMELGLTASETELRRRLWWTMTNLQLSAGVLTGCIPISMYADWTTMGPGNYEDEDFAMDQTDFPPRRVGITGATNACMFYRVFNIGRQKDEFGNRLGMTWAFTDALPVPHKLELIEAFEADLHQDIIRFCEPFDPYHLLMSFDCRRTITSFRWSSTSPKRSERDPSVLDTAQREALLDHVLLLLEYVSYAMTTECLKDYVYHTRSTIMWPAIVYGLTDVRHRIPGTPKLSRFWNCVSRCYEKKWSPFRDLRYPLYRAAGELIMNTWTVHVTDEEEASPPEYIVWLRENLPSVAKRSKRAKKQHEANEVEDWTQFASDDFTTEALLADLANTDWSFWDTF